RLHRQVSQAPAGPERAVLDRRGVLLSARLSAGPRRVPESPGVSVGQRQGTRHAPEDGALLHEPSRTGPGERHVDSGRPRVPPPGTPRAGPVPSCEPAAQSLPPADRAYRFRFVDRSGPSGRLAPMLLPPDDARYPAHLGVITSPPSLHVRGEIVAG